MRAERVKWVDAARFLGMYAIYVGHFAEPAGKSFPYVFLYHVPLFFFISGCMSYYDKEPDFWKYIQKKIKTILIPLWFFGLISILLYMIWHDAGAADIGYWLWELAKGCIRNRFLAAGLWFLSCLFSVEVIFKVLKYLKNPWIILALCIGIYVVFRKLSGTAPQNDPRYLYNVDSALYYIIFFATGYATYPHILNLFQLDSRGKKLIFAISGAVVFVYSFFCWEGENYVLIFAQKIWKWGTPLSILTAFLLIWFNLILARLLENIPLFVKIGQETLYLCGNEYIVKSIFENALGIVSGFTLVFSNAFCVYIYTFFLFIICVKWIHPFEKEVMSQLTGSTKKNLRAEKLKPGEG